MLIERIKEIYKSNEPIFTEELLRLFPDYSRVQVFRMINVAEKQGELIKYAKGIYYIPQKTRFGNSTITADDVIKKRYLKNDSNVYGVYSGIKLLNTFSVTTQMAGVVEVVTNNESAKYREVKIGNRRCVLRRSRCLINKSNVAAYTVMQLFSEMKKEDKLDESSVQKLKGYIAKEGISQNQLFSMAQVFPARATKMMIGSGIINATF